MKKKYNDMSMRDLWIMLAFMEQNNAVNAQLQDKVKYHVDKNILTPAEVGPIIEKLTKAFIDVDKETIDIEKALDAKVRELTGVRHLSGSLVRYANDIDALINSRKNGAAPEKEVRKLKYD